jgi:phosphatidylglycerol lysyltransferase
MLINIPEPKVLFYRQGGIFMDFPAKRKITQAVGLIITAAALYFIHNELSRYSFTDIRAAVADIPLHRLLAAFIFMVINYAVLTLNDGLALRYIGKTLNWPRIAFASFISNTLSFNFGMSLLTGGSSRYSIYSSYGLSATETAKILGFCNITIGLGSASILGILLLSEPTGIIARIPLLKEWGKIPGFILLLLVIMAGILSWSQKSIKIRNHNIPLPSLKYFFAQILISILDFLCASMVLFSLLPNSGISLFHYIGCYVISVLLGSLSQVPGGLGVLDSTLMITLSPWYSGTGMIGALMIYRLVYYIFPLCLSAGLLGWRQFGTIGRNAKNITVIAGKGFLAIYPVILSISVFVAGAILLFSSATPGLPERLSMLNKLIPVNILELSHFLSSIAGLVLLFLAQGIRRRLRIAWIMTMCLLSAGIGLSILKGLDYEEASILGILLISLAASRKNFNRDSKIFFPDISFNWFISAAVVLASAAWLGYFSHKHLEFADQTILQFAISGKAPWFLKASVSLSILVLLLSLYKLFRVKSNITITPSAGDIEKARIIVNSSGLASAFLALTGDKSFFFSPSGNSMVFFAEEGPYWFVMGDPLGDSEEFRDLAWSFREKAAMNGSKVVYYEATDKELPLYIEQGLVLIKIGESGKIPLSDLSFDEGSDWRGQRYTLKKLAKDGSVFRVIPREEVGAVLTRLKEISEQWLKSKQGREKGFSLGFFNDEYISNFPVAIVERGGEIQAFANLWASADKNEISPDMMRYMDNAPADTMEFLFLNTILWAKAQGFAYFDLGMAPLSGITGGPYGSLWGRAAEILYEHGNIFYNFQGLRRYKEKYNPVWESRYLAVPHELSLPSVLAAAAVLISKGPRAAVKPSQGK